MRIGFIAKRLLAENAMGTVIAVFDRSAYLDLGSGVVCLAEAGLPEGPLMVPFARPGALRISDRLSVRVQASPSWQPPAVQGWTVKDLRRGLSLVPDCAFGALAPNSSTDVSRWFARCLSDGPTPVPESLLGLLGLGPGLTPSGDDFLGGAMVAAHALSRQDIAGALYASLDLSRTHRISASHLRAATEGAAAAPLHALLNEVLCGRTDRVPARLTALDRMGHSSGRDAWAGCRAALQAYCAGHTAEAA